MNLFCLLLFNKYQCDILTIRFFKLNECKIQIQTKQNDTVTPIHIDQFNLKDGMYFMLVRVFENNEIFPILSTFTLVRISIKDTLCYKYLFKTLAPSEI